MNTTHLRLTYHGPSLDAHTIDVRMLAPALLAFGDLCEDSGRLLYGQDVDTRVEVKASFRTGSFGIDLSVTPQLLQQVMHWLNGETATAIANGAGILGVVGTTGGGLIGLLRWLKNRRITRIESAEGGGKRVIVEDGDRLIIEEQVIILLQSRVVRTHLQRVIEPIESAGVERVAFGGDDRVDVVIERAEAAWFRVPPPEDALLVDETRTVAFSIVSLSFKDDNKWRLSDGQNTVYVTLSDEDFMARVNGNLERFAKGDILIAETRITHWQTADGLRTDYTILHVREHRQGAAQISLPLS